MRKLLFGLLLIPGFTIAQNKAKAKENLLKNAKDSFSYAVGTVIAGQMKEQGIRDLNYPALNKAFADVFNGGSSSLMSGDVANGIIQKQLQELNKQSAAPEDPSDLMGKEIPEFEQSDVNGKSVNIKSFRGKYVLIDFWASWCGPCRGENPNVVAAFNKYKDKNFTVLGISLDKSKDPWLQAIQDDALTWTQLSDLKGWGNAVAQKFRIQSIPQNFLIDPNGVVIGKNLRGQALEDKLAEVIR
jgi:peroxiredoxin